jgi:hypothetical protein
MRCVSSFRRSTGDLLSDFKIPKKIEQHMKLPAVLALHDDGSSVHYFVRDEYDSDSDVECVALPMALPLVPLRRDHTGSTCASSITRSVSYQAASDL